MKSYAFGAQLLWSDGVTATVAAESILLEAIPGATAVRRATREEDRTGVDWWVELANGHALAIDMKARSVDPLNAYGTDDLALEVWSVVQGAKRKQGWTLDADKRCDYILWVWMATGRWCLVPFPMLCTVFRERFGEWMSAYREFTQDTGGRWQSSCIFVPRKVVWRAIYDRYGGERVA